MSACLGRVADYKRRDGHQCDRCRAANNAYEKRRSRDAAYGRTRFVDAAPVLERVQALRAAGLGWKRIGELSGIRATTVARLLKPRAEGKTTRKVKPGTAAAIMAIPFDAHSDHALVPAVGTFRRLQALVAIGWSQPYLADRVGMSLSNFRDMFRQSRVTAAKARTVAAVYAELWHRPPAPAGPKGKASVVYAQRLARKRGWHSPLAWNDGEIDDPDATPSV